MFSSWGGNAVNDAFSAPSNAVEVGGWVSPTAEPRSLDPEPEGLSFPGGTYGSSRNISPIDRPPSPVSSDFVDVTVDEKPKPKRLTAEERAAFQYTVKKKGKTFKTPARVAARRALAEDDALIAQEASAALLPGENAVDNQACVSRELLVDAPTIPSTLAESIDPMPTERTSLDSYIDQSEAATMIPWSSLDISPESEPMPSPYSFPDPEPDAHTTMSPRPAPPVIPDPFDILLETGDFEFDTSDGEVVRTHLLILRTASPRFRGSKVEQPSRINHSRNALMTVLRLLYPMDDKPMITNAVQLREVLATVDTLQVTSFVVRDTLNELIKNEPHPLRSWALATAFKYPDAQRTAVKRYFASDSAFLEDVPEELHLVDAYQIVHLNAAKERAIKAARDAMVRMDSQCDTCCGESLPLRTVSDVAEISKLAKGKGKARAETIATTSTSSGFSNAVDPPPSHYINDVPWYEAPQPQSSSPWHRRYIARTAEVNPFVDFNTSEAMFEICLSASEPHPNCGHSAMNGFGSRRAKASRTMLRDRLKSIISQEVNTLATLAVSRVIRHSEYRFRDYS
ncbi:hypothetical protein DL93DRAFT_2234590 [Clavulina sp. PMI_390]|nr:hypothetical protein DL93DRAFT_2234590 [Clavulina sp. PMI_390]